MLEPNLNQEQGLKVGIAIDQVGKGGREDAVRSDLQMNLHPANPLTLRCHWVRKGPRAEAQT